MASARHILVRLRNDAILCVPDGLTRTVRIRLRPARAERGAVAIMFGGALIVFIGLFALAVDLSRLYNRRIELQNVADAVALAAARQIDGTSDGVQKAIDVAALAAAKFKYNYNHSAISWSKAAIKFGASSSPDTWWDADSAKDRPGEALFVKVDTDSLNSSPGTIATTFLRALPSGPATLITGGRAIAGPSMINVTPFAICAMSTIAADQRANPGSASPTLANPNVELVEYGFRRGVGYDLMQLNPDGLSPKHFLVNPVAAPGTTGSSTDMTDDVVGPFLCAGTVAMWRVTGGKITVEAGFRHALLFDRFNSRFDDYSTAKCDPWAAPPDKNIKQFSQAISTNIPWMAAPPSPARPGSQAALSLAADGKRRTVADPLPAPSTNTAPSYGVLWSFSKAVPFASYTAGKPEPSGGYATFTTADWSTLYDPGRPAVTDATYQNGTTPYLGSVSLQRPRTIYRPGIANRRVLNVPLLLCPVTGSSAEVLAIGKFFMTVPATNLSLHTEFAGVAPENSLGTKVELHP